MADVETNSARSNVVTDLARLEIFLRQEFPCTASNAPADESAVDTAMTYLTEMKQALIQLGVTPADGW